MSKHPLVSVVIPAYNAEKYIDEALCSVLAQTYSNIEIIVVDDGSTDGTAERVAAYSSRVRCYQRSNSGGYPGVPRNTGIERCSGEYIGFLDADDMMLPDRVEKQAEFLTEHPDAGVVFSDYQNFSADGVAVQSHFQNCPRLREKLGTGPSVELASADATGLLVQENFGIPSSMMIRRDVLSRVPSFSTDMQVGEDFHYYYRVARHFGVGVVNRVGSLRRLHNTNMTNNVVRMLHNCILSRTSLRDTESNVTNRRRLNEFLFHCEIDLARAYTERGELSSALVHNVRALTGSFPASLNYLRIGLMNLVRTGAIAVHLKKPGP